MEIIFWLIILLIWFFSFLLKKTRIPQPREETDKTQEEIEKVLETLGFPIPPRPKIPKEITPKFEKTPLKEEVKIEKPVVVEKKEEFTVEEDQEPTLFPDSLEQGIILSTILGPPKALRKRRGAWNW